MDYYATVAIFQLRENTLVRKKNVIKMGFVFNDYTV